MNRKLNKTLAKVQNFVNDLQDGIKANDTAIVKEEAQIALHNETIDTIKAQSDVALKLLSKLQ